MFRNLVLNIILMKNFEFNPLGRNAPHCALLFLLVQRQTILLVSGEALQFNGLKVFL
jgi:hypothetical protein